MAMLRTFRRHPTAPTILLFVVALSGTSATLVRTDATTTDPVPDVLLINTLLRWIGAHSDYDVSAFLDHPPVVRFCDCGDHVHYEGRTLVVTSQVEGFYDKLDNIITLVKPWRADDPYNLSTLLHELTHVVQYHDHDWLCWQRTEWEAYKLQEAWLLERGVDPGFNWLQIQMLSDCRPRDIHPALDCRLRG